MDRQATGEKMMRCGSRDAHNFERARQGMLYPITSRIFVGPSVIPQPSSFIPQKQKGLRVAGPFWSGARRSDSHNHRRVRPERQIFRRATGQSDPTAFPTSPEYASAGRLSDSICAPAYGPCWSKEGPFELAITPVAGPRLARIGPPNPS